jgi:hypothetical protein
MKQGSYPLNGRSLAPSVTTTGVVAGATADIPYNILAAFLLGGSGGSGPTVNRPAAANFLGQPYFDTDLGFPVFASQLSPAVWVNAAGVQS